MLQIRHNDELKKKTLIRLGPYEQIMLCHVEFHKKNVKDKKVLCFFSFFFFAVCAVMSSQTLSRSGAFPGSYKANVSIASPWIVKSQPPKFQ